MVQSATQKVKVDGKFGDEFDTFLGVKQGDPQNTHWPAGLSAGGPSEHSLACRPVVVSILQLAYHARL